jgi:hypothetical protein
MQKAGEVWILVKYIYIQERSKSSGIEESTNHADDTAIKGTKQIGRNA